MLEGKIFDLINGMLGSFNEMVPNFERTDTGYKLEISADQYASMLKFYNQAHEIEPL